METERDGVACGDHLWPDPEARLPGWLYEEIRAGAAAGDRDGRIAERSLKLLAEHGYPGLPVPRELRGGGCSLLDSCSVQRRLAMADPALAIATNMHLFSVGVMVEHWRRNRDTSWMLLEAIASQRRFVASAFAEPNLGGSVLRSTFRARREAKGYRVSGVKRPCSLTGFADLVCLQLQTEQPNTEEDAERTELLIAVLPADAEGVTGRRSWDGMGMRASASDTLLLEDCFVPDDLVFHRSAPGEGDDPVFAAGLIWFCLTTTATYLGVLRAATELAAGLLHKLEIAHLGAKRAELPSYQGLVGDAMALVLPLAAATAGLARMLDAGEDPHKLLASALAVKQQAIAALPAALSALAEAVGGPAYSQAAGFERLWRDAQAIRFHPPTPVATRQYLGRASLGLPASLDLDEAAPGSRTVRERGRTL